MFQLNNNNEYKISEIAISKIQYDKEVKNIIGTSNPLVIFQNSTASISIDGLRHLLCVSPIVGYFQNDKFHLYAGFTTFNIALQVLKGANEKISVLSRTKKPNRATRKQFIQLDLTHSLVNRVHINCLKKIGVNFDMWFTKDSDAKSVHGSQEWKSLYPDLNTKEKFAAHICVSKRNL